MSRAAEKVVVIDEYSVFAALEGTSAPPPCHSDEFEITDGSPRSVRATILRVFDVVPEVFVTHISMRLMVMPVVTFGMVFMYVSYFSRK